MTRASVLAVIAALAALAAGAAWLASRDAPEASPAPAQRARSASAPDTSRSYVGIGPDTRRIIVRASETRLPIDGAVVSIEHDDGSVATSTTGADGVAVIAEDPTAALSVRVTAPGRERRGWFRGTGPDRSTKFYVPVDLAPGIELRGRVVDAADGKPISGAAVGATCEGDLHRMGGPEMHSSDWFEDRTATDADGRFVVPAVRRPEWFTYGTRYCVLVQVHAPGYVDAEQAAGIVPSDSPADESLIRLERAASVEGTVTLPDGSPAADAAVQVETTDRPRFDFRRPAARTDVRGAFRVDGLRPGARLLVRASKDGFAPSVKAAVTAGAGPPTTLRLRSVITCSLVVTASDGSDVGECDVAVFDEDQQTSVGGPSGPSPIELRAEPGRVGILVSADGFASAFRWFDLPEEGASLGMKLDRAAAAAGVVVDDEGRAVGGADVAVGPVESCRCAATSRFVHEARTAPDGTFRVEGLGSGELELRVSAVDHESVVRPVRAGETDVRIVLSRTGSLDVALVPPAGVDGPQCCGVYFRGDGPRRPETAWEGGGWWTLSGRIENGRLRVDHLPAGRWDLEVLMPGFLDPHLSVEILPGRTTTLSDVRLDPGLAVEGVVLDPRGRPVPGARVQSISQERDSGVGDTDASGRFRLPQLRAGRHVLVTSGPHIVARAGVDVGPATPPVTLRFVPTREVRIRLSDARGEPVVHGVLHVVGEASGESFGFPDVRGQATLGLLPGRYETSYGEGWGGARPATAFVVDAAPAGDDTGVTVDVRLP